MTVRRDRADWVAYGSSHGRGRPKIGEAVSTSLPEADLAELDAIGAARGLSRPDMLRQAVTCYLRHHHAASDLKET